MEEALYALAHAPIRPEFRINYTIKDTEAAKNQLLGKAVRDSKEKAKVLTDAAEVTLGEIITIDYISLLIILVVYFDYRCVIMLL